MLAATRCNRPSAADDDDGTDQCVQMDSLNRSSSFDARRQLCASAESHWARMTFDEQAGRLFMGAIVQYNGPFCVVPLYQRFRSWLNSDSQPDTFNEAVVVKKVRPHLPRLY